MRTTPERPKRTESDGLEIFHELTARWFRESFAGVTAPQREGWPAIARGESTLILAPTGTGKTLTAFLWCLDRLMFGQAAPATGGCRVLYVSPLKALAVDVERNLRVPLAGIAELAEREGVAVRRPEISVRSGDTSARDRARFLRHPGEILITTPESLYLMLTSRAAGALRSVETVILDEIHVLVPSKRGAHLALSLERLEALTGRRLQRIGLSATQRPLDEVARYLGGAEAAESSEESRLMEAEASESPVRWRPVTVVNAGAKKRLELRVEVPVEDMARLGESASTTPIAEEEGVSKRTSIWQSIYPRLLEIVRSRRSTLIFVNARRIAERLAGSLNDLAGEAIARAHHGSLAAAQRSEIEELLKAGQLRALVCTSSLELGIDMGAVDLVVQIEAPPSVASGMQRIGRAGHQVGAPSAGILFPKFRADLIACAAVTQAMHEGHVEATRYLRNPLDVLAQQIVACVARPPVQRQDGDLLEIEEDAGIAFDQLLRVVRGAAGFAQLSEATFAGVLDMLSGRYPSDEFAELRPRLVWDRERNWIRPRQGARQLAILNGGTIPDRGLYGVFLAGRSAEAGARPVRVGELDEEMVFEARAGETFVLGASTWRIEEILHDRVLVTPAPGEPGKMPFWHGDRPGRPIEFGRRIGRLVRELGELPPTAAVARLVAEHDLDALAAENLVRFLADQRSATTVIPDDRSIVIERVRDELGAWRVCVLTPLGSRVHAPWAMAAAARWRDSGVQAEAMWTEDGFVLRLPESDEPPAVEAVLLKASEAERRVLAEVGQSSLFAGRFREAAGRALLLPRRRAQARTPLWQQRKRSHDLLAVASQYPSFPILLEAYRECLGDVFDMPALLEVLRGVEEGEVRVEVVDSTTPSPFARSLLFGYVANYIYDGDAPLAERRMQALAIDQDQLRELLGDADLRELLDSAAIGETEAQLQGVAAGYQARSMDGLHDLLLRLGDLTRAEVMERCEPGVERVETWLAELLRTRRALEVKVAGEERVIAVEDAARYRDGVQVVLPEGVPSAFLHAVPEAVTELLRRFARTHGPFTTTEAARRFGWTREEAESPLQRLTGAGRLAEGGFRPEGSQREWVDVEVLRTLRRKSLARLRREVEPVSQELLVRLTTRWQGVLQPRRGLDALLDVVESLQGSPLPASLLESEILAARIVGYQPSELDTLVAAGEVVWVGLEPLGERDGRVGLYLAERLESLWVPTRQATAEALSQLSEREQSVVAYLREHGATFFQPLHDGLGGGYPGETLDALWALVWRGWVRNDALHALRAYCERPAEGRGRASRRSHSQSGFRSRRTTPPTAQGRWSLNAAAFGGGSEAGKARESGRNASAWSAAMAQQLLLRYGVVLREHAQAEGLPGGFSAVYDALKTMEESGRVRRGYFAAELGATQFALPQAVEELRALRGERDEDVEVVVLAATDPANLYGSVLRWPEGMGLTRSVGARVALVQGSLAAYWRRGSSAVQVRLPEEETGRVRTARVLAGRLVAMAQSEGLLIGTVNGVSAAASEMKDALVQAGFVAGAKGMHLRRAPVGSSGSE